MTKALLRGVLGILALAVATAGVVRAEGPKASQPYVVLVGVSQYADPQILPRPHAEADVKAFYDLFTDKSRLGVEPSQVKLLLGGADSKRQSEPATHANVLKALHWAAAHAKRDDLVVVAFVGQGAPLGERTCYFVSDSTFKDRDKNALAASEIEQELKALKSHKVCVLLDVNFKGFDTGKDTAPELTVENLYQEFLGGKDKDKDKNKERDLTGRVLILANNGMKPSLEGKEHGLFTQVVLDALKGAADKEGYEPDGVVTVHELIEYVDKTLPGLVIETGKTREEKEQRHFVLEALSSHFVLSRNPAVTAKVQERLDKFAKVAEDKGLSKEVTEEGLNFLGRMPKLKAQQTLRKAYQQLADGELTVDDFQAERAKILDGMKYRRADARGFAEKVLTAAQTIREDYVKELNLGDLVGWAVRGLYQRLDETIPAEVEQKLKDVKELKESDLRDLLADVRQRLGSREDLEKHKDIDFALGRMMSHLDPYTSYMDPETVRRSKSQIEGNFTGIGIQIRKDPARDMLLVVTPIKDSPAYKAGIKAGDVITEIRREVDSQGEPLNPPEVLPTKGLPIDEAVKKILGQADTQVKLKVEREGVDKPLEFEITRGTVNIESVLGVRRTDDDGWDYWIDPQSKIGYIRLLEFARNSDRDMTRVVSKLQKAGVKGLVLDLRFNPGGLLPAAVHISDLFIEDGTIVTIRPRVGREQTYYGRPEGSALDFPMVCLVNGQSASGSEIVAACLQDHHRAVIMGERSYGKGSVQNIQPFDKAQLRLTVASFWRPSGKNLNKSSTAGRKEDTWGVTPDKGFVLDLSAKERDLLYDHLRDNEIIPNREAKPKEKEKKADFRDRQLEMAVEYLRGQIKTAAQAPSSKAG